ncbi:beta-aspartyl-peptidase [Nannocystis bainbridge]|uniref:Isoaspartyl dipeptidase n=1 Tax=Nannocystis bainbridge TaxID=2995303 RepID=A0ABT5DVM7_9BACT|nr:beta-aspartyl-peptidase [Nannocystis bainbridge]MDC0717664.1 beta-aspartyl-peptidase [Nannocystis bainbridge]
MAGSSGASGHVPSASPPLLLLRGAEVFAPAALGVCDVLLAGGKIAAIAPELPALPPELAAVHDLRGHRLIPGLIDAHVHLIGGGGEAGPSTRVPPITLSQLTRAGITSVVGVLGTDGTTRTVADLVARTLGLRDEGLSAWCYTGSYELPVPTLTGSVRRDLVFVDPIIGVGELALSDHRSSQPTLDELLRVAADVHVGGMMAGKAGIVHLHMGDGLRGLDLVRRALDVSELPPRVFHPTHVNRNRRLFIEAGELVARGCSVDVTAFPPEDDPGDSLYAADAIDRWIAQGLPVSRLTCSSDGAGCMPVFDGHGHICAMDVGRPTTLSDTLTELLARGRDLAEVLPIFTVNVADLLRLGHKGRLAAGADADLVALDDHGHIAGVIARGRWLIQGGQTVVCGPFERSAS